MRNYTAVRNLLCILSLMCLESRAIELNGLAPYEKYGKEMFILALSSKNTAANMDDLQCANSECRMELRVTAENLPLTSYNRLWRDSINTNNDQSQAASQVDNLNTFLGVIRGPLQEGDIVAIDSEPNDQALKVSVNGIGLGTIADVNSNFYQLLLQAWVGPSQYSGLRTGLLANGRVDNTLLQRFNSTTPATGRIDEIKKWLAPAPKPKPTPKNQKPAIDIDKEAIVTALRIQQEAAAAKKLQQQQRAEKLAQQEAEELARREAAIAAAEELASRSYNAAIPAHLKDHTASLSRVKYGGSAVISVTIDRNGNIVSTLFMESDSREAFNKAVEDTIRKAEPFPPIPGVIRGDYYSFDVPIRLKTGE